MPWKPPLNKEGILHDLCRCGKFNSKAGQALKQNMEAVCRVLQTALKQEGDWQIYPFAVHDLIARGRVELDGRKVYVDNRLLPEYGYRIDCGG